MLVRRNLNKEEKLLDVIRDSLEKRNASRPSGIHVSDLVAPLKAYYRKKFPLPLTEDEIGWFFSGNSFELMFSRIGKSANVTHKSSGIWNDINYEIDFLDEDGVILELKSSRSGWRYKDFALNLGPELIDNLTSEELVLNFETYIQQIKKYMVIYNIGKAYLYILFLNLTIDKGKNIAFGKKAPRFRVYEIDCDSQELVLEENNMFMVKNMLEQALLQNNPNILPFCPDWMCKSCKWHKVNCAGNPPEQKSDPTMI